jgi:hypothetical protein
MRRHSEISLSLSLSSVFPPSSLSLRRGNVAHGTCPVLGGACGFKHTNQYPFMSMGSCGNQPLFKDGKGCGSCYKVQ